METKGLKDFDEIFVKQAHERIKGKVRCTPCELSYPLSQLNGCRVFLKLENQQLTGSFKLRGAMNKVLQLSETKKDTEVITASTGNHALGVSCSLQTCGMKGTVFLPEQASKAKLEALGYYNVQLKFHETDCMKAEMFAKKYAEDNGFEFISPYNDFDIICGQGTIGVELLEQVNQIDAVFVPCGGGGLLSGVAGYLKSVNPKIRIYGCQPLNDSVMSASIEAGRILEIFGKPTLSDGTSGAIEAGSITFDFCKKYVDEFVLVEEDEIRDAMVFLMDKHHQIIEGSGSLPVAAYRKICKKIGTNKNVVLVLSGGNISLEKIKNILQVSK